MGAARPAGSGRARLNTERAGTPLPRHADAAPHPDGRLDAELAHPRVRRPVRGTPPGGGRRVRACVLRSCNCTYRHVLAAARARFTSLFVLIPATPAHRGSFQARFPYGFERLGSQEEISRGQRVTLRKLRRFRNGRQRKSAVLGQLSNRPSVRCLHGFDYRTVYRYVHPRMRAGPRNTGVQPCPKSRTPHSDNS